jgi:hypothetical protein
VIWAKKNPAHLAMHAEGDELVTALAKQAAAAAKLDWHESNYLLLRRGPYVIASGLEESIGDAPKVLTGHFVNLFDPELKTLTSVSIEPGKRFFLRDLGAASADKPALLASAARAVVTSQNDKEISVAVEGVSDTPGLLLLRMPKTPSAVTIDGKPVEKFDYSDNLLRIHFANQARPVKFTVQF